MFSVFFSASFTGQRSCCKNTGRQESLQNRKLGTFQRIVRGDSFRIPSVLKGTSSSLPPARILDLQVHVNTGKQLLEFTWTAPGEDFDKGNK